MNKRRKDMFNQVLLFGRVCAEPIIKNLPDGKKVGEMTLAVSREFKNAETGEYDTDFVKVSIWQSYANVAQEYCTKGSVVGIKGHLIMKKVEISEEKSLSVPEIYADKIYFINLNDKENK